MKSLMLVSLLAGLVFGGGPAGAEELGSCCARAKTEKRECHHLCCQKAKKSGKVCEKCNPKPANKASLFH